MWEMSKMPAAFRTARCSSTMLEYCTGISHPPNSISLPPSFWCAAKIGERLSDMRRKFSSGWTGANENYSSAPLFEAELVLGQAQVVQDEMLRAVDERVGPAGVKHAVRHVGAGHFLDPLRRDAPAAARPGIGFAKARAGDVKLELGIV